MGEEDAEFFAKQFAPVFEALDFVNIETRNAYAKILAAGIPQKPFDMRTPDLLKHSENYLDLRGLSRLSASARRMNAAGRFIWLFRGKNMKKMRYSPCFVKSYVVFGMRLREQKKHYFPFRSHTVFQLHFSRFLKHYEARIIKR